MEEWKRPSVGIGSVLLLIVAIALLQAPYGQAQGGVQEQIAALEANVAALEQKLQYVSVSGTDMVIEGANLHVRNGLGATNGNPANPSATSPGDIYANSVGNLIVGYNEAGFNQGGVRGGSHNIVVGAYNDYGSVGGLVAGRLNTVTGAYASVTAGSRNTASGTGACVTGGQSNTASGSNACVVGGLSNEATFLWATVTGGQDNVASGDSSSISGGVLNVATTSYASVTGGRNNQALAQYSAVNGGQNNIASARFAAVGGGAGIKQATLEGWSAGSLGSAIFVGRFRSP